jgi:uncharacterized membrane protein
MSPLVANRLLCPTTLSKRKWALAALGSHLITVFAFIFVVVAVYM